MSLAAVSAAVRLFVLVATILGFALAAGALLSAHRDALATARNGDRRLLARAHRASEAWSIAAQLAFLAAGFSFIGNPPPLPTAAAQLGPFVDGLLRIAAFGVGAAALAIKSAITLVTESRIGRS
jgi:hypothetical protein